MKKINNINLKKYRKNISEEYIEIVKQAIDELIKNKEAITFVTVARTSGLCRSFLYTNKNIRETIMSLRINS